MAANSIKYNVTQDLRTPSLESVKIWTVDQGLQKWCISLCFPHPGHRNFLCVQLRIDLNSNLYNPVHYKDWTSPVATTTLFTPSERFVSTAQSREIITIPFNSHNKPNLNDVYNIVSQKIPGYQLQPDGKGTQSWTLSILQILMEKNYLPANIMSIFDAQINALRLAGFRIPQLGDLPHGTIY